MNKKKKLMKKHKEKKLRRFFEAKKSFQKMQEEITPFIKPRGYKEYSTAGKWCETSSLDS